MPATPSLALPPGEARLSVAREKARRVMAVCTECGKPPEAASEWRAECAGWTLGPSCGRCEVKSLRARTGGEAHWAAAGEPAVPYSGSKPQPSPLATTRLTTAGQGPGS
ncbi:hypothetical protein ABZ621_31375 [Streptomyces sp. NPDC007863]|uniref:hypothetical protein n=1 Tax=Streptomyces sp. NPDC007863 TaxID=3154894 RepID=UPI0033D09A1C